MNILLIAGGWSGERDVSLSGGVEIQAALGRLGHRVSLYDPACSLSGLPEAVQGRDFAFINLHGSPGEDGLIQAMLERLSCPYQGSGPAASMLALNKAAAKTLFAGAGLCTAPFVLLNARSEKDKLAALSCPLFIKDNTGGSSLHMEKVENARDLDAALDRLFALGASYLAEEAVDGFEVTCGVLGAFEAGREKPFALPPILIRPAVGKIFDFQSKYSLGGAEEICPAPLPEKLNARIRSMALEAHLVLGCEGYSRVDFIVPEKGEPVILEVNTLPGMTKMSLLPKETAAVNLSFDALVGRLLDLGLARRKNSGLPA
ncbi:MAG: D-alanine--D-alanine ligase [Desulfovibrio sp.]|jgi:D-alanine-D-alanine ligase|nr:D-alanine--D-alanine ligase [Desulfovibrio sp.]